MRGRRRLACARAATQPRDGCAAGMRNGRGAGRTPTRVSEGPKRDTLQPLRMCPGIRDGLRGATAQPLDRLTQREGACPSGADHRESEAQSFRSDPWAAVRRAKARSYAAGPGFGEREPSRFLGTKRWKSQKLRQLSPEQPTGWKASEGVSCHPNVDCSQRFSALFAVL